MHSYKSLVVVMLMGGALVVVAGVLVSAESAGRKRNQSKPQDLPSTISFADRKIDLDHLPVRETPEGGMGTELVSELEKLRQYLASGQGPAPAPAEAVRGQMNRLALSVGPTDWPVLKKELERPSPPPGYRSALIVLSGACHASEALPFLAERIGDFPTKVVEALSRNGSPEAFEVIVRLVRGSNLEGLRALLQQTASEFPSEMAAPFLIARLTEESDPVVREGAVTLLRRHRVPGVCEALVGAVLREIEAQPAIAKKALNSLGGLLTVEASAAMLELALDPRNPEAVRAAADEALAFHKHPDFLPLLVERLGRSPAALGAGVLSFVERNARTGHEAALEALRDAADPAARPRIEAVLSRIAAR